MTVWWKMGGLLMFMTGSLGAGVVGGRMPCQGGGLEDATRGARGGPRESSLQLAHHSPTKAKQANFPKSPSAQTRPQRIPLTLDLIWMNTGTCFLFIH